MTKSIIQMEVYRLIINFLTHVCHDLDECDLIKLRTNAGQDLLNVMRKMNGVDV